MNPNQTPSQMIKNPLLGMQKARPSNEVCLDWVGEVSASNQALSSGLGGTRDTGPGSLSLRMKLLPNGNFLALPRRLHMTELHTGARSMISITRGKRKKWIYLKRFIKMFIRIHPGTQRQPLNLRINLSWGDFTRKR